MTYTTAAQAQRALAYALDLHQQAQNDSSARIVASVRAELAKLERTTKPLTVAR